MVVNYTLSAEPKIPKLKPLLFSLKIGTLGNCGMWNELKTILMTLSHKGVISMIYFLILYNNMFKTGWKWCSIRVIRIGLQGCNRSIEVTRFTISTSEV